MKRITILLLTVALLLGVVSVCPFSAGAVALADGESPVTVSNEGKKTQILLSWSTFFRGDGVQIYRSETGKKGSYQRIASVRGKTSYRDTGLSANTIYYYKLRGFTKTDDGYAYTPYQKAVGATALTQSFLKKQLSTALTAAHQWMDTAMVRCKNGRAIVRTTETDEGLVTGTFREVNRGSIHSTAKLKRYLRRFFSRDLVDSFVDSYYCDYNGGLYLLEGVAPDATYYVLSETTLKNVRQGGAYVTFDALLRRPDFNQEKNVFSWSGTPQQKQRRNKSTGRIIVDPYSADWNLTLVNKKRELPKGYAPKTSQILTTGYVLDERVTPYYEAMYRAAAQDGCYLTPYSTYRSYDHQNFLFQNSVSEYRKVGYSMERAQRETAEQILYPGTSEHQLGFAIDVKGTGQWFAQTKEYRWLLQHAHEYGFILRYTAEKKPITGIIPEPWHWRYVGVDWAQEIRDSGLCLEEYLALKGGLYLNSKKSYCLSVEDGKWVFDYDENYESAWTYDNYAFRSTADVA
ncbi:MAG: M15 family metallopeptidase [Clostridia bacterium]|nr:M15 family metallopeptidase [Clostridia bacterium]